MSATTPPGWYPDPGHTDNGPAQERRWDGTAWTGDTRPARDITVPDGTPVPPEPPADADGTSRMVTLPGDRPLTPPPGPYGTPPPGAYAPYAPYPPYPPPPQGGGRRTALIAGAIVVVAALAVGFVVLLGGDDEEQAGGPEPSPGVSGEGFPDGPEDEPGEPGEPEPGESDRAPSGPADETPPPDADGAPGGGSGGPTGASAGGVTLPLLDGWTESTFEGGFSVTTGEHPCPGDPGVGCVRGGAFVTSLPGLGSLPPEDYALADIGDNENTSYGPDIYGEITGREEVLSEAVTVAGQQGHRIRTRIETASGTEAFVESVAFPAPDGSGDLVTIRLGFDIGGDAPPEADMDRIVLGAEAASGGGPGTEA
ncbi:DUF2510 domain-containing protein [Streptomyces sp. SBT349]|uniref:DUF2510 domain-containing protein n=1 Tax=Streptomyces sp. SBT349 TaxID=1580539 RepID=UPI00066ABD72|nr:DUF2510 domain-containing protein [Streptomyces sp. SBT349]